MESNISSNQKTNSTSTPLLPNYFKKIGIAVLIVSLLPALFVRFQNIDVTETQKQTIKYSSLNIFILGMFLIAWAKNKVENEQTIALRLKSIFFAFILAVLSVIIKPLFDLLGFPIEDINGQDVILSMLFIYFFLYIIQTKHW